MGLVGDRGFPAEGSAADKEMCKRFHMEESTGFLEKFPGEPEDYAEFTRLA
jgi:hypothetical protein